MALHSEAKVDGALHQMYLRGAVLSTVAGILVCIIQLTAPLMCGSPFSHQTGSGRIASPSTSRSSGLSRTVSMIWRTTELESRSWLWVHAINATHAPTPTVPNARIMGHLLWCIREPCSTYHSLKNWAPVLVASRAGAACTAAPLRATKRSSGQGGPSGAASAIPWSSRTPSEPFGVCLAMQGEAKTRSTGYAQSTTWWACYTGKWWPEGGETVVDARGVAQTIDRDS